MLIVQCRASGDPLPEITFGWKDTSEWHLDRPGEVEPLPFKEMTTENIYQPKTYYNDEPYGRLVQATVYVDRPVDELKGKKTVLCYARNPYNRRPHGYDYPTAEVDLNNWGSYPKEFEEYCVTTMQNICP